MGEYRVKTRINVEEQTDRKKEREEKVMLQTHIFGKITGQQ